MCVRKARTYPSEAPSGPPLTPGLTHTYLTWIERLGKYKHSSLLRKPVNYGHKKFYNIVGGIYNSNFLLIVKRSFSSEKCE